MVLEKKGKNLNIKKIVLNYQKYGNLITFQTNSHEEKNVLKIKGFFGEVLLNIPRNVFIKVINNQQIILYFNDVLDLKLLKYIYNNIIYISQGVLFYHLVNMSIKGIGYKFELDNGIIRVFCGNSLPVCFDIPHNIEFLTNGGLNNFSVGSSDYMFLNNFLSKLSKIALPNKYKEIGIFLKKQL